MIAEPPRLENQLARLLRAGTITASLLIAAGCLLSTMRGDSRLIVAGIGLFILLPLARVGLMAAGFARERDLRYAGIALTVLLIVLCGIALGLLDVL